MKTKKKKLKKTKSKINSKTILWAILFLSAIALVLLLLEFTDIENFSLTHEDLFIEIPDKCTMLPTVGLVHQIRDEDDCSINCNNRCMQEDMKRKEIEFTALQDDCNICSCFCS